MDLLLTAINAKYIHTAPSVRLLKGYAKGRCDTHITTLEFTINQRPEEILPALYRQKPRILAFSCYIWNIRLVLELAENFHLLCPEVPILLGGPEVSYNAREVLAANLAITYILRGEGEISLVALLGALEGQGDLQEGLHKVPGLSYRLSGEILENPPPPPLNLDLLPFPYEDLTESEGKIRYYESSRGCPYRCQYCLSSLEKPVRWRSLPLVEADLLRFLEAGVRQVKFVDRTFNADRDFARAVWGFLIQRDNGVTNFHFEISAELLDEETLALLATARPGLFQLEIGVQSTNPETLAAIQRPSKTQVLFEKVEVLRRMGNIHLHLDLIAGLPYEDLHSFGASFDQVYVQRPHQLQLGFLKLLKGSGLHRDAEGYGLICSSQPPYEVLSTPWLPYGEALILKEVEGMVETYRNSGRFTHLLRWMLEREPSPFGFFRELGAYYSCKGNSLASQSKEALFTILRDFWLDCRPHSREEEALLPHLCRLDIALHERPRKYPDWAQPQHPDDWRETILTHLTPAFLAEKLPGYAHLPPKEALKTLHVETFPGKILRDISPNIPGETPTTGPVLCIFDYQTRDVDGHGRLSTIPL